MMGIMVAQPLPRPSSDGYVFQKKQYERTSLQVEVALHKDRKSLVRTAIAYGLNEKTVGFSVTRNGKCTIHIVRPEFYYEPEIYGHELTHCIYGKWHE